MVAEPSCFVSRATLMNGACRLYVDGTQVATRSTSGGITASTGPLSIGGNGVRTSEWFTGSIDDVRVYNRALTATEVGTDRNAPVVAAKAKR